MIQSLGDALRKRRLDLGLLQREVAERIGCDHASITNWEKNHTSPRVNHLKAIVDFLGYDPFAPGALKRETEQCRNQGAAPAPTPGGAQIRQNVTAGAGSGEDNDEENGEQERTGGRTWAKRLVCFRKARGMTQKEFAENLLHVDPSTLAKWERGEREPKGRFLAEVKQLLEA